VVVSLLSPGFHPLPSKKRKKKAEGCVSKDSIFLDLEVEFQPVHFSCGQEFCGKQVETGYNYFSVRPW
jgi:hypothetical protein